MQVFHDLILPCLAAFLACIGFSLIYNIHGKNILVASLCGAFGWAIYLIWDGFSASMVLPYFCAGVAIALYAEVAAYLCHSPITVYLIPGIIPLVPGLTIYRTMEACLTADLVSFGHGLFTTLKIGGSISLGLIFTSTLFRLIRSGFQKITKKTPSDLR